MKPGLPKGEEREKQKEVLRKEFSDYSPIHHDVFVQKYNKKQDNEASDSYHKERGFTNAFTNGRNRALQEIANKVQNSESTQGKGPVKWIEGKKSVRKLSSSEYVAYDGDKEIGKFTSLEYAIERAQKGF